MPLVSLLHIGERRPLKAAQVLVNDITALESTMEAFSDAELAKLAVELRARVNNGVSLDELLVEAYALTREAGRRVLGQRLYDVQLVGAIALHAGTVAEMRTGEGKTLAATPAVFLNALAGGGVHVVTVNDYLAQRDAALLEPLYRFLGLSVGLILPGEPSPEVKRAAYACDVTYAVTNELGFDYLRDNMGDNLTNPVQRGHTYAIVDEIDSILIDEARTPLIISGIADGSGALYRQFADIVADFSADEHYDVDEQHRQAWPTEAGVAAVEAALGVDDIYGEVREDLIRHLRLALTARAFHRRDRDYVVRDGEVLIVDEFTGRTLEGRRWGDGIHQAVEAQEGLDVQDEAVTLATVTLQNYFRTYTKLAGMTGTAASDAAELHSTYGLDVMVVPTHRPDQRVDYPDEIYLTEDAKFTAVVDDIADRFERGQPVLVGTASVAASERLAQRLTQRGIPHEVLNAKQHHREAEIIAQAGRLHSVTVATNMAGRGVDVLLGGNPVGLAAREARSQGLEPGTTEYDQRVVELLPTLSEECAAEGGIVRSLGGLYVLGTERHESRRIDNQLRGRAARQGDPGESRFYLSLDDDLLRVFATGALEWVMTKTLPPDMPLQGRAVTRAVERAQEAMEAQNAEVRRQLLRYDDALNAQRKTIYQLRADVLLGSDDDLHDRTRTLIANEVAAVVATTVGTHPEDWDLDTLERAAGRRLHLDVPTDPDRWVSSDELVDWLNEQAWERYLALRHAVGAGRLATEQRRILVAVIDRHWTWHLEAMEDFRSGVHLQSMGQRDPLTEWNRAGYESFAAMLDAAYGDYVTALLGAQVRVDEPAAEDPEQVALWQQANGSSSGGPDGPCACGSWRKARYCHGLAESSTPR